MHYGTHSFGHYVGFRRKPQSQIITFDDVGAGWSPGRDDWYRVSDETVEVTGLNEVLKANPFMLFYEKFDPIGMGNDALGSRGELVPRVVESWTLKEDEVQAVEL